MNPQLPPLPEPFQPGSPAYKDGNYQMAALPDKFTAAQMTAYGLQCAEAAVERERARCADICHDVGREEFNRRQIYAGSVADICGRRIASGDLSKAQTLAAEILEILESYETSAETVGMAKRHHDLVQRLRGRIAK